MLGSIYVKYIRLSVEDTNSNSMSIENQRLILDKHLAGLDKDIPDKNTMEFVDNGHSGTNLERPAVQELLELVRNGMVKCIIVKDFSRFGRNAIEMGYFVERVFPLYGVRFISVIDNFDSDEHKGSTGGLEVTFKYLIHEYYSIDLSKKIKEAKKLKRESGEAVTKNCVFGYKLSSDRKMIIDEPAANTVRLIFNLASQGNNLYQIAGHLYKEKYPTPSMYKGHKKSSGYIWESTTISKVLNDEQYIGTYIAGRVKSLSVGSKNPVNQPESEWIKIPNHHPAVIEPSLFYEVREIITSKTEPKRKKKRTSERYINLGNQIKSKVICGCCKHVMNMSKTANPKFSFKYTYIAPDAECHKLSISYNDIVANIHKTIQNEAFNILKSENIGDNINSELNTSFYVNNNELIEKQIDEKCSLYEKVILGEITSDDYIAKKAEIDIEIARLNRVSGSHKNKAEKTANLNKKLSLAKRLSIETELTKETVDLLVEKIYVFPGNRIEINWKVRDNIFHTN